MKKIFITLSLILVKGILIGQVDSLNIKLKRNTIYFEGLGQGYYNSFSFDRLYRIDHKVKTSLTIGFSIQPIEFLEIDQIYGVPISYNWLFGQNKSHLEIGIGLTYLRDIDKYIYNETEYVKTYDEIFMTPKISYRLQKTNGGLLFRLSFTPLVPLFEYQKSSSGMSEKKYIGDPDLVYFLPWAGISIGYTLK